MAPDTSHTVACKSNRNRSSSLTQNKSIFIEVANKLKSHKCVYSHLVFYSYIVIQRTQILYIVISSYSTHPSNNVTCLYLPIHYPYDIIGMRRTRSILLCSAHTHTQKNTFIYVVVFVIVICKYSHDICS